MRVSNAGLISQQRGQRGGCGSIALTWLKHQLSERALGWQHWVRGRSCDKEKVKLTLVEMPSVRWPSLWHNSTWRSNLPYRLTDLNISWPWVCEGLGVSCCQIWGALGFSWTLLSPCLYVGQTYRFCLSELPTIHSTVTWNTEKKKKHGNIKTTSIRDNIGIHLV